MSKVTGKWRPLVTSCIHAYKRTINIDTLCIKSKMVCNSRCHGRSSNPKCLTND